MTKSVLGDLLRLGPDRLKTHNVEIVGKDPVLPSAFPIGEAAAAALGACGAAASEIGAARGIANQSVKVDVVMAAASLLGFYVQSLDGEPLIRPSVENPTVDIYPTADGRWIHLHGGFPHLEEGTLKLLNSERDAASVEHKTRAWNSFALEEALAFMKMCGAVVREKDEWRAHPQGMAVLEKPLVEISEIETAPESAPEGIVDRRSDERPLSGLRVLDLTRVLAGPACGRTLAEHGASVLNITGANLPSVEPFVIDTGHGKRSAFLDLKAHQDADRLRALITEADVFCQSFRQGGLDWMGFSPREAANLRPGIIYVSINCYGHDGPWAGRPGWEHLAQSVSGIAMSEARNGKPRLLPAAATDYTTGYLAAYGVMLALLKRMQTGGSYHVKVSLTRTAMWLQDLDAVNIPSVGAENGLPDVRRLEPLLVETQTQMGLLKHLPPVCQMSVTPARWDLPPVPLGTHAPSWD
jgi:crotonobetainyl-CoA:carnitine CoA-transferase CaiB-like acyl-CoA transferase